MFRNYIKIAWRNLWKNKFYSLINIGGLAVGLATGIMLLLWVMDEKSYDKFHKDYRNTYNISTHFQANGKEVSWTHVPGPLSVFSRSIPQVKSLVRIYEEWDQILANADRSKVLDGFHIAAVDSSFLTIFDFKLVKGNQSRLFPNINSVILTQATAKKFFGNEDAMGKTVVYVGTNFTVSGIIHDFPENSSLQYDALFPMGYYAQEFTAGGGNGDWKTIDTDLGNYSFDTYVKLQPEANPAKVGSAFSSLYKKARNGESDTQFKLRNLADIHLINADGNNAALRMVQIFMLVAILLLVIASINYVNLSTARSMLRSREVSVRKIVGANKGQLFLQFITETFLLFSIAVIIAVILIALLMPLYNSISGKELHFSLANEEVGKVIAWAVLGTLLAAGIYPALLLSSFQPVLALKEKITSGIGIALFRKVLVVFQFIISVALIVSTLVMSEQMRYVRNKNLGYDKDYVLTVPLTGDVVDHIDAVKNELGKQPGIMNISTSNIYDMSSLGNATGDIKWPGKPENSNMIIGQAVVDKDFIPTMKMQFVAGKNFSGTPADSTHYILNETAVAAMGLKPPYVGQTISFHERKGTILGVLKDFNFRPLKEKITPLLFYSWDWKGNILYVRTTAKDVQNAISAVEKQYRRYAGDAPFKYDFVDKQFEAKYKSDLRAGMLFNLFSGIAIFISCLGLFGLATLTAFQRTKEIGIRKVLGASVAGVVALLSKDFIKLVLIAIVIATPIAWYAMNRWLQDFAYRIDIQWWMFALAGLLAVFIALLTVSFQSVKAALANPVKSLRSE